MIFSTVLLSLFITMALVPVFRRLAVRFRAVDIPNERKVHAAPMPKTGGLAMAAGVLMPTVLWAPPAPLIRPLMLASGAIVAFGFLDDLKDLGFKAKFAAQLFAALVVVLYGGVKIRSLGVLLPEGILLPELLAVPLTIFVIVGVTNAINLADGLDGLAGGISLLSFICLAFLAQQAGRGEMVLVAAAMCGALFGFLRFNTYPATVFMGDAGSQLLGFLAITLALGVTQESVTYSPLLPLLLLGLPVFDTLRVMIERIRQGKAPFVADRNHLHHKLMGLGLSHPEAVLIIYGLQTLLIAAGLLFRFYSDWLLLGCYLLFVFAVLAGFRFAGSFPTSTGGLPVAPATPTWIPNRRCLLRLVFLSLQGGLLIVCLLLALQVSSVPRWLGGLSLGLGALVAAAVLLRPSRRGLALRLAVCLVAPFLVYQSDTAPAGWGGALASHIIFGLLVVLTVLTVRFSRRRGYRSTPLDFLVLLIALVVPVLPSPAQADYRMSLVAAKIIALFFSFEVVLNELRGRKRIPLAAAGGMLMIVGFRAVFE